MKTYRHLMAATLLVALLWPVAALAQRARTRDTQPAAPPAEDIDWNNIFDSSDQPAGPPAARPAMPGRGAPREGGRGMQRGEMGPGAPEPGMRGPGMRGGPTAFAGIENPGEYLEQLLAFLQEHEPGLAATLQDLRQNNPERLRNSIGAVVRRYGPIMQQMEHDPEMAEINLRRTRLTLEVEETVNRARRSDGREYRNAVNQLNVQLNALFDTIVDQQYLELDRLAERAEEAERWREMAEQGRADRPMGDDESAAPRQRPGADQWRDDAERPERGRMVSPEQRLDWVQRRREEMEQRLDRQERQLEIWRDNRDQIIAARIEHLLEGVEPFPW